MRNNKGFTLIELLAVIVILGILMIIAVPAITRYIERSKKEAFIKEINSLVDTVRYGINSGDSNYQKETTFDLTNIVLEKGKRTIKRGSLTVNTSTNTYSVKVTQQENNYCLSTPVDKLSIDSIKDCNKDYEYSVGEIITYPDENTKWRIIENSKFNDDYVVLLKEMTLMGEELNGYQIINHNGYTFDAMAYYWGPTCHEKDVTYKLPNTQNRYSDYQTSGCNGHNTYDNSYVRNAVRDYMQKYLNESDLEEVDGYKIRLIKLSELTGNLGYEAYTEGTSSGYRKGDSTPLWVYQGFSTGSWRTRTSDYWTMSPNENTFWKVSEMGGTVNSNYSITSYMGIRPVINLKKEAIE